MRTLWRKAWNRIGDAWLRLLAEIVADDPYDPAEPPFDCTPKEG